MRIAFPLGLLFIAVLGCSSPNSTSTAQPAPSPVAPYSRQVANMAVRDPNARFLGEVSAYLTNTFHGDETMATTFVSEDGMRIKDSITSAYQNEKNDFGTIDVPPLRYKEIAQVLAKTHHDHQQAYLAFMQTFIDAKAKHVDKGTDHLKRALTSLNQLKDLVSTALDRDVASKR